MVKKQYFEGNDTFSFLKTNHEIYVGNIQLRKLFPRVMSLAFKIKTLNIPLA